MSFYEGRPIQHFSDDELGRKEFARFFAEAIRTANCAADRKAEVSQRTLFSTVKTASVAIFDF